MINKIIFLSLLFYIIAFSAFSQDGVKKELISEVENGLLEKKEVVFADSLIPTHTIYNRMKFYKVPSVSIAVIENGKIVWAKAYGMADVNKQMLSNVETVYQAASITKSINALAILKLVQDNKLSLTRDVREYLKTWKFPENEFSQGKTITLRHLLSHTAGFNTSGFRGYKCEDSIPSINQMLEGIPPANNEPVKPIFSPSKGYKYSGGGTLITRKIIEDNIESSYGELIQQLVLNPLEMTNSSFSEPIESHQENFAVAYDKEIEEIEGKYYSYPEMAPDGLWSTATDIAKFVLSLQHSLNGSQKVLSKSIAEEMVTPVNNSSDAALGVFITQRGNDKYFRHSGANMGFRGEFFGSLTKGKGVVVLTNSDNGQPLIDEIIRSVAAAYEWDGFYQPEVKKLIRVPEVLLDQYAGSYKSVNPAMEIQIKRDSAGLELSAKNSERMYPISKDTFILLSSPSQKIVFSNSQNSKEKVFKVIDGENVIIEAKKEIN